MSTRTSNQRRAERSTQLGELVGLLVESVAVVSLDPFELDAAARTGVAKQVPGQVHHVEMGVDGNLGEQCANDPFAIGTNDNIRTNVSHQYVKKNFNHS